jgi:hypothetical protein
VRRRLDREQQRGEPRRDERDERERRPDADEVRDAAEHRPDDEPEHGEPEHHAERLAAPPAVDADRDPRERSGPRRCTRKTLDETRNAERDGVARERESEAGCREHAEPCDDAALRPDPADEEPARDPAQERPGAIGAEEGARLELRQVVVVGEPRKQRDDRAEQQRVEEHDQPRDRDDAAHAPRICAARDWTAPSGMCPRRRRGSGRQDSARRNPAREQENAPSRSRLRPVHPIDLRRSDCRAGEPSTSGAPCSVHLET